MKTNDFIIAIDELSKSDTNVKLYPYTNKEKLYGRFVERVFPFRIRELLINGWLGDLYKWTNGVDLANYYIVPFNNYFNKKELPFEDFKLDWYQTKDNPNQIIDFEAFMTDDKTLVGYLENLTNIDGDNFIGIVLGGKIKNDVLVIASSIYKLYDTIVYQLKETDKLELPLDESYWRQRDSVLDEYYRSGKIINYKLDYLLGFGSSKYKKYEEELNKMKNENK